MNKKKDLYHLNKLQNKNAFKITWKCIC
jgi:hypothetical protein